ncbi:MAG: TonB-dependent receptor [Flavobacteriales bacterium]|nr:TonB-dependent receptor [Flavobacteriales bacterium]
MPSGGKKWSFTIILLGIIQFGLAQSRATVSGRVLDQFGNLPGASVSIEGTNLMTTSDVNGLYSFELEEGEYVISASFVMYKLMSKSLVVKVGDDVELDFLLETGFSIDQPISLGSRDKPRSLLQTTAPIDIISPQAIENSSQMELSQILHYLVPSFQSTNQTISDGTDHIDPSALRGLGPDQLLVLVNGKRRHNSALLNVNGTVGRGTVGTDLNSIPVASIEKIEILRDGATSQYGSDAIAGVINIILKKQVELISIDSRVGLSAEGDGNTRYFSSNFGLNIGKNGYINVTGEYRKREAINRAGNYTGNVFSNDPIEDARLIQERGFFDQTGYSGQRVMEIGNAETQNSALSFNGELAISSDADFYFHGGRNFREGKAKGFYRFPKDQDRVVIELFPNGFSPEINTDIKDNSIVVGIRGVKNNWNIDFSHGIGNNAIDYNVNNSNNASIGISSPRSIYSGGFLYNLSNTNIDISKTFDWLSDVNIAFGAELRVENFQIIAGEEASYIDGGATYIDDSLQVKDRITGVQVFPGINPNNELDRFRTNSSAYLDVETNVTNKLLITSAVRYESYNDFGDHIIWKLASRYKLNEKLSLRAGYSTGFRAPSLHQVYFQSISTQANNNVEIESVGTFNNESAVVEAFKIDKLKPELSNHFSAGFSGKLKKNLTFTFDYYVIDIKDRIVLSSRLGSDYADILAPFNVSAAQFFTNAIDSRTSGSDAVIFYKSKFKGGELNASVGANFNKTKVLGILKLLPNYF